LSVSKVIAWVSRSRGVEGNPSADLLVVVNHFHAAVGSAISQADIFLAI
jgi:hypothetical protein